MFVRIGIGLHIGCKPISCARLGLVSTGAASAPFFGGFSAGNALAPKINGIPLVLSRLFFSSLPVAMVLAIISMRKSYVLSRLDDPRLDFSHTVPDIECHGSRSLGFIKQCTAKC